jgi:hypothetical protein
VELDWERLILFHVVVDTFDNRLKMGLVLEFQVAVDAINITSS